MSHKPLYHIGRKIELLFYFQNWLLSTYKAVLAWNLTVISVEIWLFSAWNLTVFAWNLKLLFLEIWQIISYIVYICHGLFERFYGMLSYLETMTRWRNCVIFLQQEPSLHLRKMADFKLECFLADLWLTPKLKYAHNFAKNARIFNKGHEL